MKQKWGKLKKDAKSLYEVVPLKKFCHGKPKPSIYKLPEVTAEARKACFDMVIEACPNSEIAKLVGKFRSEPLPEPESSRVSKEYCEEILSAPLRPSMQDQTVLFALRTGDFSRDEA